METFVSAIAVTDINASKCPYGHNHGVLRLLIISMYMANQHGAKITGPATRKAARCLTAIKQKIRAMAWAISPDVNSRVRSGGRMLEAKQ